MHTCALARRRCGSGARVRGSARSLLATQREPEAGQAVGRDPCEGSLSRSLTPTRRAAKLLQPLIAVIGSPRTSRRRARAICTLLFTRAFSGAARGLRSSGAAPRVARSTSRAACGPPVPLGRTPAARGASTCTHSSSDPERPARDRRQRGAGMPRARSAEPSSITRATCRPNVPSGWATLS